MKKIFFFFSFFFFLSNFLFFILFAITTAPQMKCGEEKEKGPAKKIISSRTFSAKEELPIRKVVVTATAYYTPLPNQKRYAASSYRRDIRLNGRGITFSGRPAKIGCVAADLSLFPIGTKIYVPGYGYGTVLDKGSAIKGYRIDLFMGEGEKGLRRALDWGVRKVEVEIIRRNLS